jgi:hypothetical protein
MRICLEDDMADATLHGVPHAPCSVGSVVGTPPLHREAQGTYDHCCRLLRTVAQHIPFAALQAPEHLDGIATR